MKWTVVKAFLVKDLKLIFRDKSSLFWIFAWPILWIILTSAIFIPQSVSQPITLNTGIVNHDNASKYPFNGTLLTSILNETDYKEVKLFKISIYNNETRLIDDVRNGELDLGIVIPRDFGKSIILGQGNITVFIGMSDVQKGQVTEAIIKGFISSLSSEVSNRKINESIEYIGTYVNQTYRSYIVKWLYGIASPINASYNEIKPKTLSSRGLFIGWYTFGAIGMVMLYTGFGIGSLMAVEEKEKGTLEKILSTPATPSEMLLGKTLYGIVILGLSSIVSILAGYAVGGIIIWRLYDISYWLVIIAFILIALFTIGCGIILSLASKTSKGANGLSVTLGLILAFLTGIWFPIWMLPDWLQILAKIFPGTWGIDFIRDVMIYSKPLAEIYMKIIDLSIATLIVYLIGIYIYNTLIKRYLES